MNLLERLGALLSIAQILRAVGPLDGKDVADIGCGHRGGVSYGQIDVVKSLTVVDFTLDDAIKTTPRVHAIEGVLPDVLERLEDSSVDVVICNNVVEHVWDRARLIRHIRRVLRPRGKAFINVPSWRGKWFLETLAFRLSLASRFEINDHKAYFDPHELWLLLIEGGFFPSEVRSLSHKLGLNTYAVCRLGR
jgi:2-polyprenyl-3-methyl-5-hydroxy-6-metoxy-1,4-benzoquinol methylase